MRDKEIKDQDKECEEKEIKEAKEVKDLPATRCDTEVLEDKAEVNSDSQRESGTTFNEESTEIPKDDFESQELSDKVVNNGVCNQLSEENDNKELSLVEITENKIKHLKKVYNRLIAGLTLILVIALGFIVFVVHLNIADVNYNNSLVELVVSQKKQLDEQTKLYNEEVKKFTELEEKFTTVEKTLTDLKKQLEEANQQVSANS